MKLVAPLWYFWSSIWSWCHYFSSSMNTSMIKKRERLWRGKNTEKTQPFRREDEASVNDEVHRVSLIGPWKPTWLWRQQSCQGQNQRTTPVNIWQWIELSFKWKKKKNPWSQLELDQVLTLVIEYGKWFGAAVYVDEETICDTGSFLKMQVLWHLTQIHTKFFSLSIAALKATQWPKNAHLILHFFPLKTYRNIHFCITVKDYLLCFSGLEQMIQTIAFWVDKQWDPAV